MSVAQGINQDNPYLRGSFAPTAGETDSVVLEVIEGEVPGDIEGTYARNGPNPRFAPPGRHHWFDGDGMIHAAHIRSGRIAYQSRFVATSGFAAESKVGRALWSGIMESPRDNPIDQPGLPGFPYKDTANTDLAFFAGELVALWYISGIPYRLNPRTLDNLGPTDFGAGRPLRVSAHTKVDGKTGEMMFFDYGPCAPYMSYGVVAGDRTLAHFTPIELPGPRLPHDMAITENYSILMDMPVFQDPEVRGKWRAKFFPELPTRFGLIPRHGDGAAIRWFDAEPCYIYHTINAWEESGDVVLIGCRTADPIPTPDPANGKWAVMMANLKLEAALWEWRINLETGQVRERQLDDRATEFPMINLDRLGRPSRFSYNQVFAETADLRFDGIVKYDTSTGESIYRDYGDGRFGSEAPFARRLGADRGDEDDGYLLSFVHDERENQSELVIYDARDLDTVARLRVPVRVPLGFHACWAPDHGGVA